MTIHTTYTQALDGLARLLDQVTSDREVVMIQRRDVFRGCPRSKPVARQLCAPSRPCNFSRETCRF